MGKWNSCPPGTVRLATALLYLLMFDIVDAAFSYKRELIVCSFVQDFSKGKGSSLPLICNAHTAFFTLWSRIREM